MQEVYRKAIEFKRKYPGTITHHRLRKHSKVVEMHLNPGELVRYVFVGQRNEKSADIFETAVVAITNKRILIGQKRVLFGYFLSSITPDLYNDMQVVSNLLWGRVVIDTVKEVIQISNISKKALPEIETEVTSFMMEAKKKYRRKEDI